MKRFALAGNPNSGKTTLFNSLTGSTAHVGNWPGVTVDKKEGTYKKCAEPVSIIDLPGIYSLSPYTPEEVISRNYLLEEKPDCVINVVDATNLERNLYLTTQLMEIDVPVVIALNMIDAVEKNGDKIDAEKLEKKIGLPVVAVSALKETGMDDLMNRAYEACKKGREGSTVLSFTALTPLIEECKTTLKSQGVGSALFHAIKLVEGDELETAARPEGTKTVEEFKKNFTDDVFGNDFEAIIADGRYKYISENYSSALVKNKENKEKLTKSDKIDKVLTHRIWGIPIFLVILFFIFHLTFSEDFLYLGAAGVFDKEEETIEQTEETEEAGEINYIEEFCDEVTVNTFFGYEEGIYSPGVIFASTLETFNGLLTACIKQGLVSASASEWLIGLICDGILGGLFSVMSFLPQILLLFLFFSILEDSGYMARIAFILDRVFRRFGLSGRSFMPMIMGFGCSVPAMINTRTLADKNERTATIRVIPFFSCGAKLPILTAVAGGIAARFGLPNPDLITYGMYLLGMVVALASVLLMRATTMRGEVPPFIMELPSYHAPGFKNLMLHLWDKTKHFIKKAFTIILASTIIIWFVSHFAWNWQYLEDQRMNESILAGLGMILQPIFTPLGFGSQLGEWGWIFVVAAITGLIAKENVIATFGTLGACILGTVIDVEADGGAGAVLAMIQATGIGIPGLISFIAFNMLTIPCFAATATAKAELNDKKSFRMTLLFWIFTSYTVSMAIYLIAAWWWTVFIFLALLGGAVTLIVLNNKGKLNFPDIGKFFKKFKRKKSACNCCDGCCNGCKNSTEQQ